MWRRGDERAPHKPLLILYALGRLQTGASRLIPFDELEKPLTRLLEDFGPPRKSVHPGALGYAAPYAKTGTRIHILYDRLGVPAESAFAGLLLGHVMAHELAHVLGYAEHSAEGVMKAKWDDNDLVAMRRAPMSFSVEEAAAIRQTVDVYLSEQDASSLLLGPGKPLASRIFQKIGVHLNWRSGELTARQAAFGIRTATARVRPPSVRHRTRREAMPRRSLQARAGRSLHAPASMLARQIPQRSATRRLGVIRQTR